MKNVIKSLERRYNSFIKSKDNRGFVIGLAEYVKYIQTTTQLYEIIKSLLNQKRETTNKVKKYEKKAVQELIKTKSELIKIIKKKNIALEELVIKEPPPSVETDTLRIHLGNSKRFVGYLGDRPLEMLEDYENNPAVISSTPMSEKLDSCLFEVASLLSRMGYHSLVEKFVDNNRDPYNIRGNFVFSKTLQLRKDMNKLLAEKRRVELWGCWDELKYLPHAVFDTEDELREFFDKISDKRILFEETLLLPLNSAERMIWHEEVSVSLNPREKENYIYCAKRIHNYLLENLEKVTASTKKEPHEKSEINFDPDTGILHINEKKIKIRKFSKQYHVLTVLFKERDQLRDEWFFSEIRENLDHAEDVSDKSIHDIIRALKQKIAIETGRKDFFITTTQSVKINASYL